MNTVELVAVGFTSPPFSNASMEWNAIRTGGAAVTEEIVPGFHFSRASYVYSLFRPQIVTDLKLKDYGLEGKN